MSSATFNVAKNFLQSRDVYWLLQKVTHFSQTLLLHRGIVTEYDNFGDRQTLFSEKGQILSDNFKTVDRRERVIKDDKSEEVSVKFQVCTDKHESLDAVRGCG